MVEEILGKDQALDIYRAGKVYGTIEKKGFIPELKALWNAGKESVGAGANVAGAGVSAGKNLIDFAMKLGLYGLGTGTVAGVGYNLVKDRLEQESPEEEYNRKLEAMYKARSRELDDSKWIRKVKAMRDELKRGYKHMTTKEYTEKYNALLDALDERSA